MSWMQKLYETYEYASKTDPAISGESPPLPPSHTTQQAHVEITIDGSGNFLYASIVQKEETLIPASEKSMAARTVTGAPHPLCDKIQYVAGDYPGYGGEKPSYFKDFKSGKEMKDGYITILKRWRDASLDPKVNAVYEYVKKCSVVSDLVKERILHIDDKGKLIKAWREDGAEPEIFKVLTKKSGNVDQGDAFVRWCVNVPGEKENRVWHDNALIDSWMKFDASSQEQKDICFVTGERAPIGFLHPSKIRHAADNAKLISSNDQSGFTFRGRLTDANQACSIGYEASQKAHSALRWLVRRQGWRNDEQVIVAWEVSGKKIPSMMENSFDAFFDDNDGSKDDANVLVAEDDSYSGDSGQTYARKLNRKISGYRAELSDRSDIVVMGLDSSTPGRMAITYYRELKGSEFLARIEDWHESYAWFQYYEKNKRFTGAPSPKDIADAAYGRRINAKISKSTVSRILPCIVDGIPIPRDLEKSIFHRTVNRVSLDYWEWEKILGIACGLYRGLNKGMKYGMSLERERRTRDYLYGRLLAVADKTEQIALSVADESRET
ncbi:MAG: type I-C CRISPR-associated protein Cas8c/Csd1, partial [Synergistaceae bacterium]|nr:type I-C CRISPR-associated protein Cas8c/Csd1 [Synergistaceae bacterium]